MIDFEQFAHDVHANAVRHGWWDEPATFNERKALIHDEWSEALEEYRNGKEWFYFKTDENGHRKPEGIASELIDGLIRMLDIIGRELEQNPKIYLLEKALENSFSWYNTDGSIVAFSVPALVNLLHDKTSAWFISQPMPPAPPAPVCDIVTDCIAIVFTACEFHGIDPEFVLLNKHQYNLTRSYRHGNKLC